jgi:hypothetical protein
VWPCLLQGKTTGWIRKALPFFDPTPSFFMVDVRDYKGENHMREQ